MGTAAKDAGALGYQYDIACAALHRMLQVNVRHAEHAWNSFRRDPIAPYVLSLLFAVPTGPSDAFTNPLGDERIGGWQVRAASRMWLDGPETRNLPDMLYNLECQVAEQRSTEGWALREQLVTTVDAGTPIDAIWAGVAVSSLDTPTGTWAETAQDQPAGAYVPGTIRILLNVALPDRQPEHAWLITERRGIGDYSQRTVHSTHRLANNDFDTPIIYSSIGLRDLFDDPWHQPVLPGIAYLDTALRATTHFAAPRGRPPRDSLWRRAADTTPERQS